MNIISTILNSVLNIIFGITGDWGITIILLTLFIKLILTPLSLKQKLGLYNQGKLSKELESIKDKYKHNKEKLDMESQKYFKQNSKTMFGCLISLMQLPIIFSLYNLILNLPVQVGTFIVPWVLSIKLPDNYFVIPLIYSFINLVPNFLPSIQHLNEVKKIGINPSRIIISSIFSIIFTVKSPIAIGIYFITSSLWNLVEEIIFRLYMKYKLA